MKQLKPLIEPIVNSTIGVHTTPGQMGYGRVDNPTRLALECELAKMESAKFALAFSSGSAALAAVFSLLKSGDVVVRHVESYEGTVRMLEGVFAGLGIQNESMDFTDVNIDRSRLNGAKLVICESITNPCLIPIDVGKIARLKAKKSLFIVDNTIATPEFAKPLAEGADISIHSLTKYISGHHDVIAGALMTNDPMLFRRLRDIQWTLGMVPSPQDCSLVLRGMETFKIRMAMHVKNARIISSFLKGHKAVSRVAFPGISGVVSCWIKGNKTSRFLHNLTHIRIAHSFGGTQTTIMHPRSMMTFSKSDTALDRQGITDNLVRISVGIEDFALIRNDLDQALRA